MTDDRFINTQYNHMTRDEIAAIPGAEIYIKFEVDGDLLHLHGAFRECNPTLVAIAIDYLRNQLRVQAEFEASQSETKQ